MEAHDVVLELRAEGGVLNGMDLALEPIGVVAHDHARAARAQMGMVVNAEKHIQHHVAPGNCSEKAAHEILRFRKITYPISINGARAPLLPAR